MELQFLAKESQAAIPEQEFETSLYPEHPSGTSCEAFIERELFQILTDCHQLSVPYEQYVPRYPNSRFISLEDLKDLFRDLDRMWSQRKREDMFDHATDNNFQGVRHASFNQIRTGDAYLSTPSTNAAQYSAQHEEVLDMLLDTVEDFDEGVALEVLAEIVEPGASIYKLQAAGHTDYAHDIEVSYPYDISSTVEYDCGVSATMEHGTNSVISSTTQGQCSDNMVSIGYDIRDFRDMERATTAKTSSFGISSALDDRQFPNFQRPTPSLTATHIPVDAAVKNQQINTTLRRPFWRCNKLY